MPQTIMGINVPGSNGLGSPGNGAMPVPPPSQNPGQNQIAQLMARSGMQLPPGYQAGPSDGQMNQLAARAGMQVPQGGFRAQPAGLGGSYAGRPGAAPMQRAPVRPWEQSLRSPHNSPYMTQSAALSRDMTGGVRPGSNMMGGPSVAAPSQQGPSLEQIQAEMQRRQVGAQLGPRNGALAGYMMAK